MYISDIKNKKILILNDGTGISNYGLNLTSKSLIELFKLGGNEINTIGAIEFHRGMNSNFMPLISRISKRLMPSIQYGERIPDSLDQYPEALVTWYDYSNASERHLLRSLSKCDAVIYNAEGSTHSDNLSAKKGLFLLFLAARMGKMTFFMNGSVTLQEYRTDKLAPVLAHVANHLDMIYLREHLSHRNVSEVVGASNCNYLP